MENKNKILKSGTLAERSGVYARVGVRGEKLGTEITAVAGTPLPPTRNPGEGFVLVKAAKHKK